MAKRFTDTNKYKKPFVRALPGPYKLLWDFLYHDCDHAGVWIVDFEIAQSYVGRDMPVNREDAIRLFNSDEVRIIEIDNGKKWFLPSFIEFQYGQLSEKNRAHMAAINQLRKYLLLTTDLTIIKENKPLVSPLEGAKDKDKDKDKEMEKEQDKESPIEQLQIITAKLGDTADFEDYEQWTTDVISGNDWLFLDKARNMNVLIDARLPDFARSHLALLAKYPKMRPTDQNRFRISLIGFIQERLTDTKNGTVKEHRTPANAIIEGRKKFGRL